MKVNEDGRMNGGGIITKTTIRSGELLPGARTKAEDNLNKTKAEIEAIYVTIDSGVFFARLSLSPLIADAHCILHD